MPYLVQLPRGFAISDDPARLDLARIHRFVCDESYWGRGRTRDEMQRAIAHSLCFGLYAQSGELVGFARIVSDRVTRGHLHDVFILPDYRGRGLGKALVGAVLAHPDLQGLHTWSLSTRDAQALYAGFGFGPLTRPEDQMMRTTNERAAAAAPAASTAPGGG